MCSIIWNSNYDSSSISRCYGLEIKETPWCTQRSILLHMLKRNPQRYIERLDSSPFLEIPEPNPIRYVERSVGVDSMG